MEGDRQQTKSRGKMIKRFAARILYDRDGRKYTNSIVEVENGVVNSFYPLIQELPATIWLVGEIIISFSSDLEGHVKEDLEMQTLCKGSLEIRSACFAYHLTTHGKTKKLTRLL